MSQWRRCKTLAKAIPRLNDHFAQKAIQVEGTKVFPLFKPKVQEAVWRTTRIKPDREASILVPLVSVDGQPSLLYTTRSENLSHPLEVSFPGGHSEVGESYVQTAIRETQEELLGDYPWHSIEIIGQTTPLPSLHGSPVTAVIGVLPFEITHDSFPGNPHEVEDVFTVTLQDLLKIETSEHSERFKSNIPVFTTESGKRIWGLTAVVTRPILHKLLKPCLLT